MMPHLDGPGVFTHLHRQPGMIEQRAWILMTATHGDLPMPIMTILDRWQIPLLRKPFDLEQVLITIQQQEQRLRHRVHQSDNLMKNTEASL
jgi:FixJ family two-component response regulator